MFPELFQPIHVITIACLIEFLVNVEGYTNGYRCFEKVYRGWFTVGSKVRNRGKGLDNILSCADVVRIICNKARLLKKHEVKLIILILILTGRWYISNYI